MAARAFAFLSVVRDDQLNYQVRVSARSGAQMKTKRPFVSATFAVCALLFVFISRGFGATYYVDYTKGSDSSPGTSKETAWKRHPYMNGWTGSYTHAAGDRFIFKGGEVWPNSTMQLLVTKGGAAGNPDTYGVDKTWFTAPARAFTVDPSSDVVTLAGHGFTDGKVIRLTSTGRLPGGLAAGTDYFVFAATTDTFQLSAYMRNATHPTNIAVDIIDAGEGTHHIGWTQPKFDGGGLSVTDSRVASAATSKTAGNNCMVQVKGTSASPVSNVTFDNIEVTGLRIVTYTGNNDMGWGFMANGATEVVWTNCYVHDWVQAVPVSSGTYVDGKDGGFYRGTARYCTVKGPTVTDSAYKSDVGGTTTGCAFLGATEVDHCNVSYTTQGLWRCGGSVHHSSFHTSIAHSIDRNSHGQHFNVTGACRYYNNVFSGAYDLIGYFQPNGSNTTQFFYNNIVYDNPSGQLALDWDQVNTASSNTTGTWILNNTVSGAIIRIGVKTTTTYGFYKIQNNLFIKDNTAFEIHPRSYSSADNDHNVTLTTSAALALGLKRDRSYRILEPIRTIAGAGVNLKDAYGDPSGLVDFDGNPRPNAGAWSIGAFEPSAEPSAPANVCVVTGL